jgi:hypothetical protein
MSLEQAIQGNTTALLELIGVLESQGNIGVGGRSVSAAAPVKAAPPPTSAKSAATPTAISYDDIKKAGNALILKRGREALVKVLESFQLPNAQAAKPEGYPMLLAAINKAAA